MPREPRRSAESAGSHARCASTRRCAVSDDVQALATTDGDNRVVLWDLPGGGQQRAITGDNGEIKALAFRPRHGQLASAGSSGPRRTPGASFTATSSRRTSGWKSRTAG